MPIPSEFTPILQSLPLVSSEWDEENRWFSRPDFAILAPKSL